MTKSCLPGASRFFLLVAILSACGYASEYSAIFPELRPLAPDSNTRPIGLARVEDNRPDRISGKWQIEFQTYTIFAGSDLDDYIERRFRNVLVEQGFDPRAAQNPTDSNGSQLKTIVITLQSVNVVRDGGYGLRTSVDIAVQVYPPHARIAIFAKDYQGEHLASEADHTPGGLSVYFGKIIAAAADGAVQQGLSDPQLSNVLK